MAFTCHVVVVPEIFSIFLHTTSLSFEELVPLTVSQYNNPFRGGREVFFFLWAITIKQWQNMYLLLFEIIWNWDRLSCWWGLSDCTITKLQYHVVFTPSGKRGKWYEKILFTFSFKFYLRDTLVLELFPVSVRTRRCVDSSSIAQPGHFYAVGDR